MKETVIAAVVAFGAVAAVVGLYLFGRRREVVMLQRWAEQSQVELLHFRQRAISEPAPFSSWTSHRRPNYFVRVRDREGKERSGWLRLGSLFESVCWDGKDKVEVRWEER